MELRRLPHRPRGSACEDGCTGVHSYTADDTRWCWAGAQRGRHAVDAERIAIPPPHLTARAPGLDFWRAWTELEVVAKLTGTPVLALLYRQGLGAPTPPGIIVEHRRQGEFHCCLGEKT